MTMFFTTSWDDGSVHDLKVAELLSRFGMKGTFYVPKEFSHKSGKYARYDRRLTESELAHISRTQEIGSHGLTHRSLTELSLQEAQKEVTESKQWLESVIGGEVGMFCYPNGRTNDAIHQMVAEAGYQGARTTQKLVFTLPPDPFAMGVSALIQPYPFRKINASQLYWRRLFDPLRTYRPLQLASSWGSLARKLFLRAQAQGNYFHLYGHSWELAQYGLWGELASFLEFVHTQGDIHYVANRDIAAAAHSAYKR